MSPRSWTGVSQEGSRMSSGCPSRRRRCRNGAGSGGRTVYRTGGLDSVRHSARFDTPKRGNAAHSKRSGSLGAPEHYGWRRVSICSARQSPLVVGACRQSDAPLCKGVLLQPIGCAESWRGWEGGAGVWRGRSARVSVVPRLNLYCSSIVPLLAEHFFSFHDGMGSAVGPSRRGRGPSAEHRQFHRP